MFSTALHVAFWYKFLIKDIDEMDDGSLSRLESKQTRNNWMGAVFDVDSVPLQYTLVVGT